MKTLSYLIQKKPDKYHGIRPINIFAMRAIYVLMAVFLGIDVWGHILSQPQPWNPSEAVNWSIWAAFTMMAVLGIFRTVQMIPLLVFEALYKSIWLLLVALPLWQADDLSAQTTEGLIFPFALVVLPIVAIPWGYVCRNYLPFVTPNPNASP